ncbi:CD225/dispanin family protein [Roseimaritima ulvae]|uniref:Interferon-induced transmembrane protein n=1 Tax=Roseimaritima ulvae TaxID=980254 RepID=A0A5B9QZ79_9BACT|nr:CD225/dispanin family protein [Roseimaritima ulvae]QEG43269.1 Interferon-induced transmembrane protein [Roseimaritima ulvae]
MSQSPPSNPYQTTGAAPAGPVGTKPNNYLVQSILVTLCCCLPLGIVAIIFAAQVDSKWNSGDHAGAVAASENAKKWSMIALVLGIIANIGVVILQVVAGVAAQQQGGGF